MLKRLLKGGMIYALSDLLRKVSPFILLPLFISTLSLDSFGKLEFITIVSTLFSFVIGWGSVQGLLRLYVEDKGSTVFSSLLIILLTSIASIATVSLFTFLFDIDFIAGVDDLWVFYICIAFGMFYGLNNVAFSILRIEERLLDYAKYNLLATLIQLCIISYFLLYLKLGFYSKIAGLTLSNFLMIFILYKNITSKVIIFTVSKTYFRRVFDFYTPICGNNLLGWAKSSIDKIAVKAILGDEALGLYSFAVQLCQMLKLGVESFLKSLNVLLYKDSNLVTVIEQKRLYLVFLLQFLAIAYFFILIALNSTGLLGEYTIPFTLLAMLMCSRVILLTSYVETLIFYTRVNSGFVFKSSLLAFLVLMVVIYPLTTLFGLTGAALSLIVSTSVSFMFLYNELSDNKKNMAMLMLSLITPWFLIYNFM